MNTAQHPADQLALVRQKIGELQQEEAALKREITALPEAERIGSYHEAVVTTSERTSWKGAALAELAAALGAAEEEISRCRNTATVTTVRIREVE